jgi:hypothetical protein
VDQGVAIIDAQSETDAEHVSAGSDWVIISTFMAKY